MNYYISRNGNQIGPLNEADILEGFKAGRFLASDHCIRQGESKWRPLAAFVSPADPAKFRKEVQITSSGTNISTSQPTLAEWTKHTFKEPLHIVLRSDSTKSKVLAVLFFYSISIITLPIGGVMYLVGHELAILPLFLGVFMFPVMTLIGIPVLLIGLYTRRSMIRTFDTDGLITRSRKSHKWDDLLYVEYATFTRQRTPKGNIPARVATIAIDTQLFHDTDRITMRFVFNTGTAVLPPLILNSREIHENLRRIPAQVKGDVP